MYETGKDTETPLKQLAVNSVALASPDFLKERMSSLLEGMLEDVAITLSTRCYELVGDQRADTFEPSRYYLGCERLGNFPEIEM